MRNTRIHLVGAVIAALLIAACSTAAPQPGGKLLGPVSLFTGKDYLPAAAYVAQAEDLFAKNGVEVTHQTFNSGADAITAVRSAKAGFVMAGLLPSMKTWAVGDMIGIAPVGWSTESFSVLAAANIKSPADLVGKKAATVNGSSGQIYLTIYLQGNGLEGKVEMVNLSPGDMPVALNRGDIAAYMWTQATTDAGLKAVPGAHLLQKGIKGIGNDIAMISAAKTTTQSSPDTVVAVLKALNAANNFIATNPDQAAAIVAKFLGVEQSVARKNMDLEHYTMLYDDEFVKGARADSAIALKLGMISSPLDLKNHIDTTLLRKVDPKLVTAAQ
ncbi:MAG TPA: ABC transporter substrate-binding protein [Gemmatimonadaceae bacterium]|nr:ABC transporter substrate-binding protein [Gemmatimonadaceae bacterium]